MPKGNDALTAAYDQALSRIDAQLEGHRNLAHLVLSWVIHARRPLTVDELRHALAMARHSTLDPSALHDPKILTAFCAGLVVIDHENGAVRLVHYTAQSYFQTVCQTRYSNADQLIAETCLQYLLHLAELDMSLSDFETKAEEYDGDDHIFLPFAGYATREWPYHVRDRERDLQDLILQVDGKFALWICALSIWGDDMDHYCDEVTLLMVAAFFGFEITLKKLLERGEDVKDSSRKGHTALHYAVIGIKPHVASILLDYGAIINAQATKGRTPLHYALWLPCEPMLSLLLERGADVNMSNQHFESALHIVVEQWEEERIIGEGKKITEEEERPPYECGVVIAMLEWWKENEDIDREQILWNITNTVLGNSRADFDRLGRSLLQFAEKKRVPERVIQLIHSRIPKMVLEP